MFTNIFVGIPFGSYNSFVFIASPSITPSLANLIRSLHFIDHYLHFHFNTFHLKCLKIFCFPNVYTLFFITPQLCYHTFWIFLDIFSLILVNLLTPFPSSFVFSPLYNSSHLFNLIFITPFFASLHILLYSTQSSLQSYSSSCHNLNYIFLIVIIF